VLISHPLNVTTPDTSDPEQPDSVPGPPDVGVLDAMARPTVELSDVTTLPPASSTATTGWVVNAVPPAAPEGWFVKASCAAAPTATLKALVVAEVSEPSVASSAYPVPSVLILQPLKEKIPDDSVAEQPDSAPGPPDVGVPVAIERVTVELSEVTTLPEASSTDTTGSVPNALPPVAPEGWVVTASWCAAPGWTLNVADPVTDDSLASIAVRVLDDAS
jgi:hypothetical protein